VGSTDSTAAAAPASAPAKPGTEKALIRLGDIICTQTAVVTPLGRHAISGLRWTVQDHAQQRTSHRLARRLIGRRPARHGHGVTGELHVIVEGDAWQHTSVIPATSLAQVTDVYTQVLLARSLSGSPAEPGQRDGDDAHRTPTAAAPA
jgi:hypothetical protein